MLRAPPTQRFSASVLFVARLTARRRRGGMAMRLPPSADVEEDAVASPLAANGQGVSSKPPPFFRGTVIASPSSRETAALRHRRDLLCRPTSMGKRFRAPWPLPLAAELISSLRPFARFAPLRRDCFAELSSLRTPCLMVPLPSEVFDAFTLATAGAAASYNPPRRGRGTARARTPYTTSVFCGCAVVTIPSSSIGRRVTMGGV